MMGNINRTHYLELNHILWDTRQKYISPKLALEMYERRWAYVEQSKLIPKEKQLIEKLTKVIGQGVFMPAVY